MKVYGLMILAVLCTGCASMMTDSLMMVSITTDPPEAICTVKGPKGFTTRLTTPGGFSVERGSGDLNVVCTKGDLIGSGVIEERVAGAVWGNILFGGLIGLAWDAGTGKMWKYPPAGNVVLYEKDKQPEKPQVIGPPQEAVKEPEPPTAR